MYAVFVMVFVFAMVALVCDAFVVGIVSVHVVVLVPILAIALILLMLL